MSYLLRTYNLTKSYGDTKVVNMVNMNIRKGEIYGFLGQNGAGKTTTMRMLLGLIKPSSGEIEMFGEKVKTTSYQRPFKRIGSIIETPGFYPNLTGEENLEIHRRMMGVPDKKAIYRALEEVGLSRARNKKVKAYSLGMKQRLGIARAILHEPELLLLDEPTNGLDPIGIKEVRKKILELAHFKNITVLISSHILSEVEQLADKIGIIHQGKLLKELDSETIRKMNRRYLEIRVNNENKAAVLLEKKLNIPDFQVVEPGVIRIYGEIEDATMISRLFIEQNVDIYEMNVSKDTLEDFFVKLTG
ncbi:ABC transporter ATP-binding protein [Thermoactinomyces mirandus]|uniref:ABC transporter ATP-binding protein n=1 Tax=Thermoactinomyces mirandus TaxID=2756294 RepID=A0A7W1XPP9_9BACL|nr:ABC transporter ATP-binding protein [Thermoactinomyces mirandus]MBA4601017.1 ABC transporter ATP-binding protein [Thermoactinomyces mirandus]